MGRCSWGWLLFVVLSHQLKSNEVLNLMLQATRVHLFPWVDFKDKEQTNRLTTENKNTKNQWINQLPTFRGFNLCVKTGPIGMSRSCDFSRGISKIDLIRKQSTYIMACGEIISLNQKRDNKLLKCQVYQ